MFESNWIARSALLAAVCLTAGTENAQAQCNADWGARFPYQSVPIDIVASAEFDDGAGPDLFVGGYDDTGLSAWLFRWDGTEWSTPDQPFQNDAFDPEPNVTALGTWDDGTGEALYVAGEIRRVGSLVVEGIARWDGTNWSALGTGLDDSGLTAIVSDIESFDDGSGSALYVSGLFNRAGAVTARSIARWDGTAWSDLDGGTGGFGTISDLQVFDDGTGLALYAAGGFTSIGSGVSAASIARWDGNVWTEVGGGTNSSIRALGVFDDGTGAQLYAAGSFTTAGGVAAQNIARWNGSVWTPLGSGILGSPNELAVFDDGTGPGLYVSGILFAGGMASQSLARWNGAWSVPAGVSQTIRTLALHDDGFGPSLFAGGDFQLAGGKLSPRVARFDGAAWSSVGSFEGLNDSVDALIAFDDGDGEQLYVGGTFTTAGDTPAQRLVRWDGATWSALGFGVHGTPGTGTTEVSDFAVFDGGSGPALYAGGYFTFPSKCIVRWDGASWQPLGFGVNGINGIALIEALAVFDDGGGEQLYAAGNFTSASGVPASWIARWDGTNWSQLGPEVFSGPGGFNARIHDLLVHDDGTGPALYAAGSFSNITGVVGATGLARWDGSSWSALGNPAGGAVRRLVEYTPPGSSSPVLVAAGDFLQIGGAPASRIAMWDGASWTPLSTGLDNLVVGLGVFDDGVAAGERLFVSGFFSTAGGVAAPTVALWDGSSWSPAPGGPDFGPASALAAFDADGTGRSLYLGGIFGTVGGEIAGRLVEWKADCAVTTYCTGKTNSLGCVPFITTTGAPSATAATPFRVIANDVPNEIGRLWYSFKKSNLNFHGAKLCVKSPLVRLPHKTPKVGGTFPCQWTLTRNFNARIQSGADPQLTPGQTVFAQWRGRDPSEPQGFGDMITNAVRFTIAP